MPEPVTRGDLLELLDRIHADLTQAEDVADNLNLRLHARLIDNLVEQVAQLSHCLQEEHALATLEEGGD